MKRNTMLRRVTATLCVLLLAVAASAGVAGAESGDSASGDTAPVEVFIELRVWQDVDDAEDLWVSARPSGGSWRTLGTVEFPRDGSLGHGSLATHLYGDLAVAGVKLRLWWRVSDYRLWLRDGDHTSVYVRACGSACQEFDPWRSPGWRPLGMIPLPLDDGASPGGRYRYGDLTVAVPPDNPGLLADREHLLALRDALEGRDGPEGKGLNWSAGTAITSWEGVAVAGTPPRVTKLLLSERGLLGTIWGWLGNLTELTDLRLDGNRLKETIPSKVSQLTKLRHVYLGANWLTGCIPPSLTAVPNNDLPSLGLPDCPPPTDLDEDLNWGEWADYYIVPGGTYSLRLERTGDRLIFDLRRGSWFEVDRYPLGTNNHFDEQPPTIFAYHVSGLVVTDVHVEDDVWIYLDPDTGVELERSAYNYSLGYRWSQLWTGGAVEPLAASMWLVPASDGPE